MTSFVQDIILMKHLETIKSEVLQNQALYQKLAVRMAVEFGHEFRELGKSPEESVYAFINTGDIVSFIFTFFVYYLLFVCSRGYR